MLPRTPPRVGQNGFLYVPPYRIQGISIAGEQTVVQIPELSLAFDIGLCPRIALASDFVALSHGHMDHVAGLPYYFSQRMFQKMVVGTCVCHEDLAPALLNMMDAWVNVEQQHTKHKVVGLAPGDQFEIKNNIMLRALPADHTVPALSYAVIEYRSKLREEYCDLPQDQLRDLKKSGKPITQVFEIPLIAYSGDTQLGPSLYSPEFTEAKIVVSECTFFDQDHRSRATSGKHLHVADIVGLLDVWKAEAVILIHTSRRMDLERSREKLLALIGPERASRVHFLMDHRRNRARYECQQAALDSKQAPPRDHDSI